MKQQNKGAIASATKYWYFRFPKNFFNSVEIIKMETQMGGYEYLVILLKLYCLSTEQGGVFCLPATETDDLDIVLLSEILRHKVQAVGSAMEYFTKHGFVELVAADEAGQKQMYLHFPDVKYNTGQSSKDADRKRVERGQKEASALPGPAKTDERAAQGKVYGEFKNVILLDEEYRKFTSRYENAEQIIQRLSIWKARSGKPSHNDYAFLLSFAETDGVLKQSERKRRAIAYELYKREAEAGCPPPSDKKELLTEMQWQELCKIAEKNFNK